jgi:5-formyltetrahydrofolate cyclo-ligase
MQNKHQLRQRFKQVRGAISSSEREKSEKIIAENFLKLLNKNPAVKTIAGFMPTQSEVNILPLLEKLITDNYNICLPFIGGDDVMIFKQCSNFSDLINNKFGIKQPLSSCNNVIPELIIVPLLACDNNGHRLGYGQGYYDKTINSLKNNNHQLILVGLCFDQQVTDQLPTEEHDQKLDYVITTKGMLLTIN